MKLQTVLVRSAIYFPQIASVFFFFVTAYAAIGPDANVYIGNKYIQPDGFNRSWVFAHAYV